MWDLFASTSKHKLNGFYSLSPLLENIPNKVLELVIADQLHGDVFGLLVPGPHLQDGGKV